MKVWLVTDGDYSDYRVEGIYSTQEKAMLAKKLFCASNDIEEWLVDDFGGAPAGMFWYRVQMDKKGNATKVEIFDAREAAYVDEENWEPCTCSRDVLFCMWAKDETHAVKIANERRIRLIESGDWNISWEEWRNRRTQ